MPANDSFSLTNGFAMQYGAALGAWSVATGAAFVGSMSLPALSSLYFLMCIFSPVLACLLTMRFRRHVAGAADAFGFGRGFVHTLLMGLYACIWLALAVYVYLAYFDGGAVFDAYEAMFTRPEVAAELERNGMKEQIDAITGGRGAVGLVDALRAISPANYAALVIYFNIIIAPFISLVVALVCKRCGRPGLFAGE